MNGRSGFVRAWALATGAMATAACGVGGAETVSPRAFPPVVATAAPTDASVDSPERPASGDGAPAMDAAPLTDATPAPSPQPTSAAPIEPAPDPTLDADHLDLAPRAQGRYPLRFLVLPKEDLARRTQLVARRNPGWSVELEPHGFLRFAAMEMTPDPEYGAHHDYGLNDADYARALTFERRNWDIMGLEGPPPAGRLFAGSGDWFGQHLIWGGYRYEGQKHEFLIGPHQYPVPDDYPRTSRTDAQILAPWIGAPIVVQLWRRPFERVDQPVGPPRRGTLSRERITLRRTLEAVGVRFGAGDAGPIEIRQVAWLDLPQLPAAGGLRAHVRPVGCIPVAVDAVTGENLSRRLAPPEGQCVGH